MTHKISTPCLQLSSTSRNVGSNGDMKSESLQVGVDSGDEVLELIFMFMFIL